MQDIGLPLFILLRAEISKEMRHQSARDVRITTVGGTWERLWWQIVAPSNINVPLGPPVIFDEPPITLKDF